MDHVIHWNILHLFPLWYTFPCSSPLTVLFVVASEETSGKKNNNNIAPTNHPFRYMATITRRPNNLPHPKPINNGRNSSFAGDYRNTRQQHRHHHHQAHTSHIRYWIYIINKYKMRIGVSWNNSSHHPDPESDIRTRRTKTTMIWPEWECENVNWNVGGVGLNVCVCRAVKQKKNKKWSSVK